MGKLFNKIDKASSPPADAPIATIGKSLESDLMAFSDGFTSRTVFLIKQIFK